jgi:hypothetical protein
MTKQEMIDKIYEVISDKTLSFGCKIQFYSKNLNIMWDWSKDKGWKKENILWLDYRFSKDVIVYGWSGDEINYVEVEEEWDHWKCIIWHPVYIWSILDWVWKEYPIYDTITANILNIWKEKRKPIEDNPEAIEFIYSLIS